MRQKSEATKPSSSAVIKDIRRITRKQYGREVGMIGKVKSALERLVFFFLMPRQSESALLRRYFKTRYDIVVGRYSYGCFDRWRMPGPLRIGRYCSIAKTVRVVDSNHPTKALTTHPILYEKRFGVVDRNMLEAEPLIVEDDVWIGHNVVILPGCKFIGRGAIIGAGAIVTADVPAYGIVAGVPARLLRMRFSSELIEAIENTRWWLLDTPQMRELIKYNRDMVYAPDVASLRDFNEGHGPNAALGRSEQ